jgi:uncharacterized protein (TIGR02271 family)
MTEHIVVVYETDTAADAAAMDLERAGIPAAAIRRYRPESTRGRTTTSTNAGGGFWAWLLGEEDGIEAQSARFPADHDLYERGASAGHAVISVTLLDDMQLDQAEAILNSNHPMQLDQEAGGSEPASFTGSPAATDAVASRPASRAEEVIPLAEEQINIGKRTVDRGVTRVRRYAVETPVEKEVTLHGERVTIERRRPVDAMTAPRGAFEERTIEVRETEELPVVEKTAKVVEEVTIRKEATERKETVRDTVRRDEVEVIDENGNKAVQR